MIMLVMLLSSLLIQFGAITLPSSDDNIDRIWNNILTNYKNDEDLAFMADSKQNIPYVVLFDAGNNIVYYYFPASAKNSSVNSSFSCSDSFQYRDNSYFTLAFSYWVRISFAGYLDDNGQLYCSGNLKYNSVGSNITRSYSGSINNVFIGNLSDLPVYTNRPSGTMIPVYMNNMELAYNDTIYYTVETVPGPSPWQPLPYEGYSIGSLGPNGHSNSTHNDFSGLGWGHSTGSVYVTGHSTGVNPNDTTPDWTNPIQNLLGQAVNNLDKLIQNSGEIGTRIEYLGDNMINGISYLFNGISTFNDNVNGYLDYITAPVDDEIIYAHYEETALNETLIDIQDTLDSLDSSVSQNMVQVQSGDLGYRIQFNNSILGSFDYTIDFSFLDSSKNLWQPLLIALMYFTLISAILTGLPSIIQGFKGGGSDG